MLVCFLKSGYGFCTCLYLWLRNSLNIPGVLFCFPWVRKNSLCWYGTLVNFKKGKEKFISPANVIGLLSEWKNMPKIFWQVCICQHFNESKWEKVTQEGYAQCCTVLWSLGQAVCWHAWKLACIFPWFDLIFTKPIMNIKEIVLGRVAMLITTLSVRLQKYKLVFMIEIRQVISVSPKTYTCGVNFDLIHRSSDTRTHKAYAKKLDLLALTFFQLLPTKKYYVRNLNLVSKQMSEF